ncbi:MAG: DUF711 family protein [Anaerolineaceae bacterium]
MRIRSITCFFEPSIDAYQPQIQKLAALSRNLAARIQEIGFEVQTRRLATIPFPLFTSTMSKKELLTWASNFEAFARQEGFAYLSLGPALVEFPDSSEFIPEFMTQSKSIFFGAVIADRFQIYPDAIRSAALVVTQLANIDPNGFANLQFAALANVPAGVPFFPAAYHQPGQGMAVALAMECADEVVTVFSGSTPLSVARPSLLTRLESAADQIKATVQEACDAVGVRFLGFDFSPAPYPNDACSLGAGLEVVGKNGVGRDGSLAAAAVIADTLDQGKWLRTGFNGLMLPVLEDSVLARRAAEGTFSVKDLLLYSTVCGTGLDTVPIPGESSADEIAAIFFDVAALSVRLGKPLTARLMPIPGKAAGEKTNFNFDFFAPSRVLPINSGNVQSPLNGQEPVLMTPRHIHQQMRRNRL